MKRLVLMFGILAGVVSVGMGAMSDEEWDRANYNCLKNGDKIACQALIYNGLKSVGQCDDENTCGYVGEVYRFAGRYREAIPYFEKIIALGGSNRAYRSLANAYHDLQDYYNAKKYYEIACNKGDGIGCYNLGNMYYNGEGVRQDYYKAHELYKKACDMKDELACGSLALLYVNGLGVRQNLSTAKQYFGKACDLGGQAGCEGYKILHNEGVR